jgi:hypothetical protein
MINTTVKGLRFIGEDAFGLVYERSWAQSNNSELCEVIREQPRKNGSLDIGKKFELLPERFVTSETLMWSIGTTATRLGARSIC